MPTTEITVMLIKPDAMAHREAILSRLTQEGFTLAHSKCIHWTRPEAETFYQIHQGKPFFDNLVNFMSSGEMLALLLIGPHVITRSRALIGATNPQMAAPGTLRALYGTEGPRNAVHASDSPAAAWQELALIFGSTFTSTYATLAPVSPSQS